MNRPTPAPAPGAAASPAPAATRAAVGPLLRDWRSRRRRSQLDLALETGVSPRHLSCIETGRARPSAAMLLALAESLEVPLRERNRWLLAAGHAPRFREHRLDDGPLAPVRDALVRLLGAHDPYPGLVLDRRGDVVLANRAAGVLTAMLPAALARPAVNVYRASLHPDGLARVTVDFEAWARPLLRQLRRACLHDDDPALAALEREVAAYPNVAALGAPAPRDAGPADALLLPCVLELPTGRLSMFTTLTTFGTPRDLLLDELSVELFYPTDELSAARLRALASDPPVPGSSTPSITPPPRQTSPS